MSGDDYEEIILMSKSGVLGVRYKNKDVSLSVSANGHNGHVVDADFLKLEWVTLTERQVDLLIEFVDTVRSARIITSAS